MTRITGILHDDLTTFMAVSHSFILKVIYVSDTFVLRIKTCIFCLAIIFKKSCLQCHNIETNIVESRIAYMAIMLNIYGYKQTLRIRNIFYLFTNCSTSELSYKVVLNFH